MSFSRDHWWTVPALVLVTWAIYAQVQDYGFVNYDDDVYSSQNRHLADGVTAESLAWAFSSASCEPTANWFPLTWVSLMVDASAYGEDAGGFHRTNVLLHTINVVLLYFVIRQLTGDGLKSAFVAALFAVHPLNVETVAWVSERKGLLSTCFGFVSLLGYVYYARRRRTGWLLFSLLAYVLSLASKQMLVTLPILLLLLDGWPLRRAASGTSQSDGEPLVSGRSSETQPEAGVAGWRPLIVEKIPYAVIAAVFCLIAFEAQRRGEAIESLERLPVSWRLGNAVVAYGLYVRRIFWPTGLAAHYPHPGSSLSLLSVIVSGCLLGLATWIAFRQRRRRPYLLVGWSWFLASLLPVIGLVQIGGQQMADRYAYVPTIGVFLAVSWLVPSLLPARTWKPVVLLFGSGIVLVCLSLTSWVQAGHWQNGLTLFQRALAVTENNAVAHINQGTALLDRGRRSEAIEQYQAAIAADPDSFLAHNNLGMARLGGGEYVEAEANFRKALQIRPKSALAQVNLGIVHCLNDERKQGVKLFQDVLREYPDHLRAHVCLAWVLPKLGEVEEARKHAQFVRDHEGDSSLGSPPSVAGGLGTR